MLGLLSDSIYQIWIRENIKFLLYDGIKSNEKVPLFHISHRHGMTLYDINIPKTIT